MPHPQSQDNRLSQDAHMRILFAGSRGHLTSSKEQELFAKAGRELGRAAIRLHHDILIESDRERTLDRHVADAARQAAKPGASGRLGIELHQMLRATPAFPDWEELTRIAYKADHDPRYKRLGARVGGLSGCDVAILMGGDHGTGLIGDLALGLKKPIVAIPAFGGAADRLFHEQQANYFQREECQPFIQYLTSWNQKSAMAAMRMAAVLARTHSYFVSYSHEHMDAADHFELLLTRVGRVFHRDENELVLGKAVKDGLRPQIASADTFLALWSAPAAKSKWCDWERKTALELMKGTGKPRRIVFVQLDGTSVPALFKKNLHIKGATRIERVAAMRKLLDSEPLG
jgi:hypothetical protein